MKERATKTVDAPKGFADVGQRMVSWTNNLVATALIVLVGMTLGWGTLQMWRQSDQQKVDALESNASSEASVAGKSAKDMSEYTWHEVMLAGERMDRCLVEGELQHAMQLLREHCEELAEKRLLVSRTGRPSRVAASAVHSIQLEGVMPMIVTRELGAMSQRDAGEQERGSPGMAASSTDAVLSWGLAMPMGGRGVAWNSDSSRRDSQMENDQVEAVWTLFAFHPETDQHRASLASVEAFPHDVTLPPESRINMSFTDQTGTRMIGFSSPGSLGQNEQHFDRSLRASSGGGQTLVAWQRIGHGSTSSWSWPSGERLRIQLDAQRDDNSVPFVIGVMVWENSKNN